MMVWVEMERTKGRHAGEVGACNSTLLRADDRQKQDAVVWGP